MNTDQYDKIIIGAGIYGLYSALYCMKKGEKVIVLEYDDDAISRGTYINQARVHNGYHYPRSFSTAIKSAKYFGRFNEDFSFAINSSFDKIYATSSDFSWTSAQQFKKFADAAHIRCEEINPLKFFKKDLVDGAFQTTEYTFDAMVIKKHFLDTIGNHAEIQFGVRIQSINLIDNQYYEVTLENGRKIQTEYILNATYASTNQISQKMDFELFKIKYELCEIILCDVSSELKNVGITVMDGPFFSVMPFGLTNMHSLTSVTFTPHKVSYDELPTFDCQRGVKCSPSQLENCNLCINKPKSAWDYMSKLSHKYLKEDMGIYYKKSLYSMKPILMASEIDDSRPTVIRKHTNKPTFISVLSGKINTIYDLDEVL